MDHLQFIIRQPEFPLAIIKQSNFAAMYLSVRLRQIDGDLHRRPFLHRGEAIGCIVCGTIHMTGDVAVRESHGLWKYR